MKTKIILEFCANHNGSLKTAEKMLDDAAELGVWGVKFQKRDIDSIPENVKNQPRDPATSFGATYYEHRKALELSKDQLCRLAIRALKLGLMPGVSVFDMNSLEEMATLPFKFLKLPSQLYTDLELNRRLYELCGERRLMSMVSTGMSTVDEVASTRHFRLAAVTMYCRSMYPCPSNRVRLMALCDLRDRLEGISDLGYSSHDIGGVVIPWAVALGAGYVERHYTLDKTMKGSDHGTVSSDMREMTRIIKTVAVVEEMLGDGVDALDASELKVRKTYRGY